MMSVTSNWICKDCGSAFHATKKPTICTNSWGSNVEETDEGPVIKKETENVSINPSNISEKSFRKCMDCGNIIQTAKKPTMCKNCWGSKIDETEPPIQKKTKRESRNRRKDDDMMMFMRFGPP